MAWNQRSNAPEPGTVICRLMELEDGKGREFTFSEDGFPFSMFIVRKAELIRAYVNECPHTGVPLNWSPDEFTSEDGSLIICSTHGALFELDDGYCSFGPCTGDHLEQVPLEVDGEEVIRVVESGAVTLGRKVRGNGGRRGGDGDWRRMRRRSKRRGTRRKRRRGRRRKRRRRRKG